ncbi:MAG: hypothetical protein HY054_10345 [Proteobacteria bacterium]|nr:hypothetical protein [Pseudomonadota bacterium]
MLGRLAAAAALFALAGCAGMEPAGRNASRAEAPAPVEHRAPVTPPLSYVPPPPSQSYSAPPSQPVPQASSSPTVAAQSVVAPPPPPQQAADPNADVTVQAPARQLEAPHGDSRSVSERREDMQTWDHCILAVQQTYASDPNEPVLETPEDVCRRQLGQASRTAIPAARLVRPH